MKRLIVVFTTIIAVSAAAVRPNHPLIVTFDLPAVLARSDLLWMWSGETGLPTAKNEAQSAFLGNGDQGLMVRGNDTNPSRSFRFTLGRTTVYDDREDGTPYAVGNFVVDRPRLPIGYFELISQGTTQAGQMRLGLYDATLRINHTTTAGTFNITAFSNGRWDHADVHVLQIQATGDECNAQWRWTPLLADAQQHSSYKTYKPNPPPVTTQQDSIVVTTWQHLSGNSHATAYAVVGSGCNRVVLICTSMVSSNGTDDALHIVQGALQMLNNSPNIMPIWIEHAAVWRDLYSSSLLSVNAEPMLEQFYYVQTYKFMSMTMPGRAVFDLEGPFYIAYTPWPDLHWDLNLQEQYYTSLTGNRLAFMEPLANFLYVNEPSLVNNVPMAWKNDSAAAPSGASALDAKMSCYWDYVREPGTNRCITAPPTITGNLLWTMHLLYSTYAKSMNQTLLLPLVPLLQRAVNFHMHMAMDNGTYYNLPVTFSPEYAKDNNTNYDLALFRWGLQTLLHCFTVLKIQDLRIPQYQDVLQRLVPYPVGDNGFKIAEHTELAPDGHRHYSHLFMVYPLTTLDLTDSGNYALAARSVDWWCGRPQRSHYEVASSMSTILAEFSPLAYDINRRVAAHTNLTYNMFNRFTPNTFYYEGEDGRCAETPAGQATAIQDMMLLSALGRISVFAGLDDTNMTEAAFHMLRADGGVLVSSRRVANSTLFVQLSTEQVASKITLRVQGMATPWKMDPPSVAFTMVGPDMATLSLPANSVVILSGANVTPDQLILPNVDVPVGNYNYWGRQSYGPPQPPTPVEPCTAYGSIAGYTCYGGYCSSGSAEDDCGQSLAEPALHCNGTQNLQQCAQQAASLCNTTTGCNSFGLSPVWTPDFSKAKLFASGQSGLVPNPQWNVWVKNGQ